MINYENPDASHIRTHENSLDFIGGVTIPIKETPTDGFETLYFGIIPYLKGSFACALISKFATKERLEQLLHDVHCRLACQVQILFHGDF